MSNLAFYELKNKKDQIFSHYGRRAFFSRDSAKQRLTFNCVFLEETGGIQGRRGDSRGTL